MPIHPAIKDDDDLTAFFGGCNFAELHHQFELVIVIAELYIGHTPDEIMSIYQIIHTKKYGAVRDGSTHLADLYFME